MKKLLSIFFVSMFVFVGCAQKIVPASIEVTPDGSTENVGTNVVMISDFAFVPAVITVAVGDTVTWKHDDVATHNVISVGLFESPSFERGGSFSFKFEKAGTYEYYCGIHPSMRGSVVVK